jgi:P27 family predicted phage terminase small subunit
MGKRGFQPTPTTLKVLRGNPGHRTLNKEEPKPKPTIPECSEWLDEVAKSEYDRVSVMLQPLGLITEIDGAALSAYCRVYSKWADAEKELMKHGMLIKTPNGYVQQSPYVSIANNLMKLMNSYLDRFGMNPSSRSGIKTKLESHEDEFEDYLKDGKK